MSVPKLSIVDWGRLDYQESFRRQLAMVEERIRDAAPDRLVLVEHPPTVTIGRSGNLEDLRRPASDLAARRVDLQFVDRGGQATYHGPGQLVAYPILKLRRKDLHLYLDTLTEVLISVIRSYGLQPETRDGRPGIWVGGAKIASIGMAVKRWVTYHGTAFNIDPDLGGFGLIIPCGQASERMTSLSEALGRKVEYDEVKQRFIRNFRKSFGYREDEVPEAAGSKHPEWLRLKAPDQESMNRMTGRLENWGLSTVCQSAECPNQGECFKRGTATFMILGDICTRNCRFCAVTKGAPGAVDPLEPRRVARAVQELGITHAVVTSVTRDDLEDGGAEQFHLTIERIKALEQQVAVEVLVPDFNGSVSALDKVIKARPRVFNHNLETVSGLYPKVRPKAGYQRSLRILEYAARCGLAAKSGLMLGLGEEKAEVETALRDLRRAGCSYLTLGQYLAPSSGHYPVARFVTPAEFEEWAVIARSMGFKGVASGPLVRSSYRAEAMFADPEKPAGLKSV